MTLEEAIIHCQEKSCGGTQCAKDHKQLEEWLVELKQRREQEDPVSEDFEKIVEEIAEPTILNAYGTKELARRLRNTICGTSVSEDLEEEIDKYIKDNFTIDKDELDRFEIEEKDYMYSMDRGDILAMVRHFTNWQKAHLWKSADGDDLPEIDREVIAILDYDFGHYKVVYAHRPFPNGWNGINIDTEEKEHFEPVIYDKGGWNQPHILYWLDTKLPYEENIIDKEL